MIKLLEPKCEQSIVDKAASCIIAKIMALVDRHIMQKGSPMTSAKVNDKLLSLSGPILEIVRTVTQIEYRYQGVTKKNTSRNSACW